MDISVSGLNGRLAAKLPPELPLGLVFVVGQVQQVRGQGFVLVEGNHQLSCRLAKEIPVNEADEIRASGHLMFDPEQLQYFLLARDVEVVKSEPLDGPDGSSRELIAESEDLLSALAAVRARAAATPEATGNDLPVWVRKLAPPEMRAEEPTGADTSAPQPAARTAVLDEALVTMLSAAMDSEEELELTPELLAPYVPDTAIQRPTREPEGQMGEDTAVAVANLSTSYRPVNREDTDWLIILLIISFFVLTVAAIVTIILLII